MSFDATTPTAKSSLPESLDSLGIHLPQDKGYTLGKDGTITKEDLLDLHLFQRAANFLACSMIFLRANNLLARPLKKDDVKERLLGHWGTCPGLNLVWAHCNHLINKHNVKMFFVTGPGHGAPAILATTYLEGSISRFFPQYTLDEPGLSLMLSHFSTPGGFPSHVNAETPGAIHEGGELGYALAVAYGAVMDRPDLIVTCVVGDGEAETGPTAAAWHGHKFIDPKESGAVLPILHANGYKISNRTICGSMDDRELTALFTGYGYQLRIVEYKDDEQIQVSLAASMEWALQEIRHIQKLARSDKGIEKPRWPLIVLRTLKGWTGPKELDGHKIEGHWRAHQIPLPKAKTDDEQFDILKNWLESYKPSDLFDTTVKAAPSHAAATAAANDDEETYGKAVIKSRVLKIVPRNDERKMGMIRETFDAYRPLDLPDWRQFTLKQGETGSSMGATSGPFLAEVIDRNPHTFRIFSPDELASNKLDAVFKKTHRQAEFDVETSNNGGRVIEMLSEHTLQGFLQGYTLTGRVGLFPSYESFLGIITTMMVQYAKFVKLCKDIKWRGDIGSMTYIETSTLWEQHHNGYSHQNPGFMNSLKNLKADIVRIYLPPDANTMVQTLHHCLGSKNYVQLIVGAKQPKMTYLTADEAELHCIAGASVWTRFSTNGGHDPDVVLVGIGMETTQEVIAARKLLEKDAPDLRVRVVNVCDLLILSEEGVHPHSLDQEAFNSLFTRDKPIVVNFHGYVTVIRDLLFGREHLDRARITILGYQEEGTTTTPFRMLTVNGCSRFDVAIQALKLNARYAPQGRTSISSHSLVSQYQNRIKLHAKYIQEHDNDPDELGGTVEAPHEG